MDDLPSVIKAILFQFALTVITWYCFISRQLNEHCYCAHESCQLFVYIFVVHVQLCSEARKLHVIFALVFLVISWYVWYSVEVVGVIDAKQVMSCMSTSVTDICIESEISHQVCATNITQQRAPTASHLPCSDASSAAGNDAKPVRRVWSQMLSSKKCVRFK